MQCSELPPWDDQRVAAADELDTLVYLSNLIGGEEWLVQPGGGNISVKVGEHLFVKGSGTDLRTIKRCGFTQLSLPALGALVRPGLTMSDAEMMAFMARCMVDAAQPVPSVETPLHSLLPARVILHTHDVPTMALTNVPDGDASRVIRELFHGRLLLVPYARPGFPLSCQLARMVGDGGLPQDAFGLALAHHGLVVWGESARECHQRLVDITHRMRQYLDQHKAPTPSTGHACHCACEGIPLDASQRRHVASLVMPVIRGFLSECVTVNADALSLPPPSTSTKASALPASASAASSLPASASASSSLPASVTRSSGTGASDAATRKKPRLDDASKPCIDDASKPHIPAALPPAHMPSAQSRLHRVVLHLDDSPAVLDALAAPGMKELCARGTATPEHILRAGRVPLWVDLPEVPLRAVLAAGCGDDEGVEKDVARIVEDVMEQLWLQRLEYLEFHARNSGWTGLGEGYGGGAGRGDGGAAPALLPLQDWAKVVLIPGVGLITGFRDKKSATVAAACYRATLASILLASSFSSYTSLPEPQAFEFEHWPLERRKLDEAARKERENNPFGMARHVALVVGGGSGIGKATAVRFAAEGAHVIVADVVLAAAEGVATSLNALAGVGRATAVQVDVCDDISIEHMARAAVLAYGGVDTLVYSAGRPPRFAPVTGITRGDLQVGSL
eukprot:jgi/Mesvir1/1079/Mv17593-RA.3